MNPSPRWWTRSLVLSAALSSGCAVDNSRLIDGGASLPDIGADFDIPRGALPNFPDGSCPDAAARLPDGACNATTLADGAVVGVDIPPTPPPPPCNEVQFRYVDDRATSVWLSGSWLRWPATTAAGALPLTRGADGAWTVTTRVEPRGRQEYKFIIDGTRWIADPMNPTRSPDGAGGENSVLNVCGGAAASCGDVTAFDWRDAFMYFAMVDRFSDGDGRRTLVPGATDGDATRGASGQYAGGDLPGLTTRMPYLADLGVTALWLSAPYKARDTSGAAIDPAADPHVYSSYHGYWPSPENTDYTDPMRPMPAPRVEPRLGTDGDLRALIAAAHGATSPGGHGVRVLFDYVMKHVDDESGLYRAHRDWFARGSGGSFRLCGPENLWDDPVWGTRCAFTSYLAPFDFENDAARAWSVNDALWWARTYQVDGLRLDAIKHVPLRWLTDLRARINREVSSPMGGRFYLVGETFNYDDRGALRSAVNPSTMLDGQFDFPFKARLCEALFTPAGGLDRFADWISGNDSFYGTTALMSTFIGNHDIPRAIHFASRQIADCRAGSSPSNGWSTDFRQPTDAPPYERLALAFAVMLTNPGVPLMYYGDEVGLAGGGDPDNRRMMPWSDASLNPHQLALRAQVRRLGRIRATNPVLGRGSRTTLSSTQDTWVYRMGGCGMAARDIVVALNRADVARSVEVPAAMYEDLMRDGAPAEMGGRVELAPRSARVLRVR
ncbi:MAG: hypothetical protein EPO40_10385 [Myxococcaceae bacterium]|nr:MAG: hypothetical protein EPO40_10385 [Myxococcaceae bacterium]